MKLKFNRFTTGEQTTPTRTLTTTRAHPCRTQKTMMRKPKKVRAVTCQCFRREGLKGGSTEETSGETIGAGAEEEAEAAEEAEAGAEDGSCRKEGTRMATSSSSTKTTPGSSSTVSWPQKPLIGLPSRPSWMMKVRNQFQSSRSKKRSRISDHFSWTISSRDMEIGVFSTWL